MQEYLGKITKASFGMGGYQGVMIGLSLDFVFDGSTHTGDFKGAWSSIVKVDSHTKWTETDRSRINDETVRFLDKILQESKKNNVNELVGVPVRIFTENMKFKGWEILKEVL